MSKINLVQFSAINAATKKFGEESGMNPPSKAFLWLVLSEFFDLDAYEVEDSIIDWKNDCWIDAIYIDSSEEDPVVYFFQSKFYEVAEKFDRNFEWGALTKMKEAIDDCILRKRRGKMYQNAMLQSKLNDIDKLDSKRYKIVFCSNSDHPVENAKEKFEEWLKEEDSGWYFEIEYLHLHEIAKQIAPVQARKVNAKLPFTWEFLKYDSGDVRMFLWRIDAEEIAKLIEKEWRDVFDRNVRWYIKTKNDINSAIQRTCSSEDAPYFVYLNNGLTITCDEYSYEPTKESPVLDIKNLQIVNGGQTSSAIYEAYKTKKLKDGTYILVKILHIKKDGLMDKIILTTNSQTKVTSRDLRSNDEIHKLLERTLKSLGYYYEGRKNKYQDVKEAKNKRIDAEIAAQAYYSIFKKKPADAKSKKSSLFWSDDTYKEIFNEKTIAEELLLAFLIHQNIRNINKQYREKYGFVNDASLHTSVLVYEMGIRTLDQVADKKLFEKIYKEAVEKINQIVMELSAKQWTNYSNRLTFINNETIGRLVELI